MTSVVSILCKHYSVNSCYCLTEDQKTNKLFRYHNVKECKFKLHQDSLKKGYYLIEKPVWKNCCESPYESQDPFLLKIEKDNGHLQFQVHVHYRINLRALPKHADHSKYRHVRARIRQTLWFFWSHVLHARTMTVVDDDDDDDDRQFLINVRFANMCFDPRRYSCCFECGTLLCRRLESQVCTAETAAAKTKFYSKRLNKLKFKQKSHKLRNQFVC